MPLFVYPVSYRISENDVKICCWGSDGSFSVFIKNLDFTERALYRLFFP
jgi:hypothetical protein